MSSGSPDRIIVYRVDELPNTLSGINTNWNSNKYFGVFVAEVNQPSATYSAEYSYSGNPFVTSNNECSLKLYQRKNNADSPWVLSTISPNNTINTIFLRGQNTEYILAGDNSNLSASIVISSDDPDNIICTGTTVTFTATPMNGGSSPSYQWTLNSVNTGLNGNIYFGSSFVNKDTIQCNVSSNLACVVPAIASSNIIVLHIPDGIKLGKDTAFCTMDGLTLQVKDTFSTYLWNTGANTSFISIIKPGTYYLKAQDKQSCISADTILVTENYCEFAIPTAFTPNKDGHNDVFKPVMSRTVTKYAFTIYNRWGNKIFNTNNLSTGWDGYYNNQLQQADTYAWTCEFQVAGQTKERKKGLVVLIR